MTSSKRVRAFLSLLPVAVLAWSVPQMLPGMSLQTPPDAVYALSASPPAMRNPKASSSDLWLRYVIVDGAALPLETLARTGTWTLDSFGLAHLEDGEPATIRVGGRRVTVCFVTSPWSGVVRVGLPDGTATSLDLFHSLTRRGTSMCVLLAGGRLVATERDTVMGTVPQIWILVLLGGLLCAWRPWRSTRALEGWVIASVVLLHLLTWWLQGVGFNADLPGYLEGIDEVASGHVSYFPPGYSLFLAPWMFLFGTKAGFVIVGVQHLLMVLALVALRRLACGFLGDDLATLGLLLAGSVEPTLFLPQMLLSENLALAGMTGALWLAARPANHGLLRDLVAGTLAGWAVLARVVPLAAVAPAVLLLKRSMLEGRQVLWAAGRVLIVAIALPGAMALWFLAHDGKLSISDSGDQHLYNRVITQQMLIDYTGPATQRFLALMGPPPFAGTGHWDVTPRLEHAGLTWTDATSLMGEVAREGLRSDPVGFAVYSFRQALREYRAVPTLEPWAIQTRPNPAMEPFLTQGTRAPAVLWWHGFQELFAALWAWLLWGPVLGLALLPFLQKRWVFLALLAVPAGYLFVTAQIEYFLDRYVVAVLPFALMLALTPVAALPGLWRFLKGAGRDRRRSAPSL